MRQAFSEQLEHLNVQLVEMAVLVRSAMNNATRALLDADARLAESVIAGDSEIDRLQGNIEEQSLEQLALQQPVARDLRLLIAGLRMVGDLERMGDLARHVAKIARMRHPDHAVPQELHDNVASMGAVADDLVGRIIDTVESRDVQRAESLIAADDEMDRLRRQQFRALLASDYDQGVEAAIDIALLGRYYERFADHAVSLARRVIYLVTGVLPDKP